MADLVKGLQSGQAWAYERLVRDYGDRIYRFVRRMVGNRHAEDVTQEVFIRVHRSVGSYEPSGSFDSWLFTIANNMCIDNMRRHRNDRRELPLVEAASANGRPPDPSAAPVDREMHEALMRAVDELPEDQKQVFLMREEAGIPFKEIARIVRCPLNTALGRMHYAMLHLRESLKAYKE